MACRRSPCCWLPRSPTTSAPPRCSAGSGCCSWGAGWASSPAGCAFLSEQQSQHNDDQEDQPADADGADDRLQQREVAAQQVAGDPNRGRPGQPAECAEQLETPEGHPRHAGEHGRPGAQAEDKPRDKDRSVAVSREEKLGARQMGGPDVEDAAETFDKWPAAAVAEHVTKIRSRRGPEKAEEDGQRERVVAGRGPCGRRKEQRLAGKRYARAFDQDAQPGRRVTERVDDPSPIHLIHRDEPPSTTPDPLPIHREGKGRGPVVQARRFIYWTTRCRITGITKQQTIHSRNSDTRPPTCWRPRSPSSTQMRSTASGPRCRTVSITTSTSESQSRSQIYRPSNRGCEGSLRPISRSSTKFFRGSGPLRSSKSGVRTTSWS